jgi:hypothetical protein
MAGSVLMLPAIGFNCIFAVLRYPNFAIRGLSRIGRRIRAAGSRMHAMVLPAGTGAGAAFLAAGWRRADWRRRVAAEGRCAPGRRADVAIEPPAR